MPQLVFVYGTLKEGFSNFAVNSGVRVPGEFVTAVPYPLYVVGRYRLPWLIDSPGEGFPVVGQLFDVDEAGLRRMDELEGVTEPGWYRRGSVLVRKRGDPGGEAIAAVVYFGSEAALRSEAIHRGPIAEYGG